MKKIINWKLYWFLMVVSLIVTIMGQPAIRTMAGKDLTIQWIFQALAINGGISLFTLFIGLFLAKKVGLDLPLIRNWINGKKINRENLKYALIKAPIIGVIVSIVIIVLDNIFVIFMREQIEAAASQVVTPPIWQSFLSSFYGGIFEELALRLFAMTFYVWFFSWIFAKIRKKELKPNKVIMWISIIIAGIAFGLGHIVSVAQMTTLTPVYVLRIMVLNGIPGIVFGWLYWKKGLESAITAHFTGDIVLHVIPLFFM